VVAIQKIEGYVDGMKPDEFSHGGMQVDASLYNLIIIGEAVRHVPATLREKYPEVQWKSIAGLRNLLAHEYFRIELEIVWNIIHEAMPELKTQVLDILEKESLL
jgi:uncharacterized protein with HEPN domain